MFTADLFLVLKVFQMRLQDDSLTIIDIEVEAKRFQKTMDDLKGEKLFGRVEDTFEENFDEKSYTFCSIKLWGKTRRCSEANLFHVANHRKFYVFKINLFQQ